MLSTLGTTILDKLVPVVDKIRGSIHPIIGDRQWVVTVVVRTWPSGRRGDRTISPTEVVTTITPRPRVQFKSDENGVHFEMKGHGRVEEGRCTLSEISLTYSEDQLMPRGLAANQEFFYRVTDAYGQNIKTRYYVPEGPPAPDRGEKDLGWVVRLRRREAVEP